MSFLNETKHKNDGTCLPVTNVDTIYLDRVYLVNIVSREGGPPPLWSKVFVIWGKRIPKTKLYVGDTFFLFMDGAFLKP